MGRRLSTLRFTREKGRGTVKLRTRAMGKRLTTGSYRLVILPVDRAGNRGTMRTLRFTVT